jgi:predicted NAD/FAD-binding protein
MQDVCFLKAPGEGEAFCAALNSCKVANACWTTDVIDAMMFGAQRVIRFADDHGNVKKCLLAYKEPQNSALGLVTQQEVQEFLDCEVCSHTSVRWLPSRCSYLANR